MITIEEIIDGGRWMRVVDPETNIVQGDSLLDFLRMWDRGWLGTEYMLTTHGDGELHIEASSLQRAFQKYQEALDRGEFDDVALPALYDASKVTTIDSLS